MVADSSDGASETTGTTVGVMKFGVAHFCYEDLFLRVHQIKDQEILQPGISNAQVLLVVQFFRLYRSEHARKRVSVATATMATRSEAYGGSPMATPRVLDKIASIILLDWRHQLQVLQDLQRAANVVWVEALLLVRRVTRHDGRSSLKRKRSSSVTLQMRCVAMCVAIPLLL